MSEERTMEAQQRRAAKEQMIALMQIGGRWQEASAQAGIQVSRSTCAGTANSSSAGSSSAWACVLAILFFLSLNCGMWDKLRNVGIFPITSCEDSPHQL